ncbi:RNA-binding protein [Sparassis crispa]|uniref:RNA-binding protein n=1 Tax=Sparassis crispa TaxID=139825 RepID=A0A401GBT3_9APHY|nr:RNA-binding protein [Sparassis crispa]GBE79615.1 RNA-binding protein [Sparassis crispa]
MSSLSSSSDSGSDSDSASSSASKRALEQEDVESSNEEGESSSEDASDAGESSANSEEIPVLSHAEQRRQKKKELKATLTPADEPTHTKKKEKVQNTAELAPSKVPKRQNSVWAGNLSFKTTPESLRGFFDGVGEITRVHMPMKMVSGGPGDKGARKENRGFAYVDFATADAKVIAITLSEKPLEGRRLLIKDGQSSDDYSGRPAPPIDAAAGADASAASRKGSGMSKTAQKILRAQKHPPAPTLFLGNLSFETTEASIRERFAAHWKQTPHEDTDDKAGASAAGAWIRAVRMGTFEDSGKCKGWAFVDFTSAEHATAALTNPRNHRLLGRELVMEYASPDAVRRGGGSAPAAQKAHGPHQTRLDAREAPTFSKRKIRTEEPEADMETDGALEPRARQRRRLGPQPQISDRKPQRDWKPSRARVKPGAALAQAKRESASIVPSQGQKIVF